MASPWTGDRAETGAGGGGSNGGSVSVSPPRSNSISADSPDGNTQTSGGPYANSSSNHSQEPVQPHSSEIADNFKSERRASVLVAPSHSPSHTGNPLAEAVVHSLAFAQANFDAQNNLLTRATAAAGLDGPISYISGVPQEEMPGMEIYAASGYGGTPSYFASGATPAGYSGYSAEIMRQQQHQVQFELNASYFFLACAHFFDLKFPTQKANMSLASSNWKCHKNLLLQKHLITRRCGWYLASFCSRPWSGSGLNLLTSCYPVPSSSVRSGASCPIRECFTGYKSRFLGSGIIIVELSTDLLLQTPTYNVLQSAVQNPYGSSSDGRGTMLPQLTGAVNMNQNTYWQYSADPYGGTRYYPANGSNSANGYNSMRNGFPGYSLSVPAGELNWGTASPTFSPEGGLYTVQKNVPQQHGGASHRQTNGYGKHQMPEGEGLPSKCSLARVGTETQKLGRIHYLSVCLSI